MDIEIRGGRRRLVGGCYGAMIITRKVEFSASHVCRNPELSEEENQRVFGLAANRHGHGHNYVVEVSLQGEPDPVTGMVLDLKELKEILNREIVEPYDHRFLNYEVPPFDTRRADHREYRARHLAAAGAEIVQRKAPAALYKGVRDAGPVRGLLRRAALFRVTKRYQFAASHRLHSQELSEEENRALYGKCNHPYGHGHNYVVEVSARGPLDANGRAVDIGAAG